MAARLAEKDPDLHVGEQSGQTLGVQQSEREVVSRIPRAQQLGPPGGERLATHGFQLGAQQVPHDVVLGAQGERRETRDPPLARVPGRHGLPAAASQVLQEFLRALDDGAPSASLVAISAWIWEVPS